MRYLFSFVIIAVCWVTTVLIAHSNNVETMDRFGLYVCMIILTLGIYVIGFAKK
ncbi:MAG TPA: hypothetical protein VFK11_01630 [Candidatus Saccharimonadales bacterium]|nr:hypothetical protein [Candidatus Saccharimonadales bacterium]